MEKIMNQTISYYDKNAEEFCRTTQNADMSFCRNKFLNLLSSRTNLQNGESFSKSKIHILDAGCGSGRDAKCFLDAGYCVTALDASGKICEEAEKLLNQNVLCMNFSEMEFRQEFAGIWACASLLHISQMEISDVMKRFRNALKKDGILYASFKYGDGERNVNGRLFHDYSEMTLKKLMQNGCFGIEEIFITRDIRKGREAEKWINVLAGKYEA